MPDLYFHVCAADDSGTDAADQVSVPGIRATDGRPDAPPAGGTGAAAGAYRL